MWAINWIGSGRNRSWYNFGHTSWNLPRRVEENYKRPRVLSSSVMAEIRTNPIENKSQKSESACSAQCSLASRRFVSQIHEAAPRTKTKYSPVFTEIKVRKSKLKLLPFIVSIILWLDERKVLTITQVFLSTQLFLGFPVPKSKCWDGSQDSKLPLHASHVALPT